MRGTNNDRSIDDKEQILKCLECQKPECDNCVFNGGQTATRNKYYNFFGKAMTVEKIAKEIGVKKETVYNWKRYGGMEHVEENAIKRGYNPKGENNGK